MLGWSWQTCNWCCTLNKINITTLDCGQKRCQSRHCWCFCWLKNEPIWLFFQYLWISFFFSTGYWFLCVVNPRLQKNLRLFYSVILNNDKIIWPTRLRFFPQQTDPSTGFPPPRCKTTGQTLLFHWQAWGVVRHFLKKPKLLKSLAAQQLENTMSFVYPTNDSNQKWSSLLL